MAEQKNYANGISAREFVFTDGTKFTLDVNKEKFIEWLNQQPEKFVKVDLLKRREPGQYGDTHYAVKNTFKKTENNNVAVAVEDDGSTLPF